MRGAPAGSQTMPRVQGRSRDRTGDGWSRFSPPTPKIMVGATEIVIGGPGARGQDHQDLGAPRLFRWPHDKEVMLHEGDAVRPLAGGDDTVEAGLQIGWQPPSMADRPFAAIAIGVPGVGAKTPSIASTSYTVSGLRAIAIDLQAPGFGR